VNRTHRRLAPSSALALVALAAIACGSPPLPKADSITYVANSGFLIWAGEKKVLVDALFDKFRGHPGAPTLVHDGKAPFDDIDLVLATHSDWDHFSASAVSRCLKSNPRAAFVAPADAARQVTGFDGRVYPLEVAEGERRHLAVNGIGIDAMLLPHYRSGTVNLGYLITIGNQKFFHSGDMSPEETAAYMKPFNLPAEHIDVAFVPHSFLSTPAPLPLVTESIQPRVVFASHVQRRRLLDLVDTSPNAGQIKRNFPSAVLPRTELESWPIR
jgi:L-ascorbate metabolism protein UlaG (beta-lactamase superfamily)